MTVGQLSCRKLKLGVTDHNDDTNKKPVAANGS